MTNEVFAGRYASVRGIDLFYRDTEADLPALLCLHGRFGRGETWSDLAAHYATKYRVVAPDQRGHGLSGSPVDEYTAQEMADDVAALIANLGCEPPVVIGHSMGARVAGYLAARHPEMVSALVLLDHSPLAGRARPTRKPLNEIPLADAFTASWPLPFPTMQDARIFLRELTKSDVLTAYLLDSLVKSENGYSMMFSQQATSAIFEYQHAWGRLLPGLKCPVMLLRASESAEVSDEDWLYMQEVIARNTACEVSKPDHHVYLSCPGEFYEHLDQFLNGLSE